MPRSPVFCNFLPIEGDRPTVGTMWPLAVLVFLALVLVVVFRMRRGPSSAERGTPVSAAHSPPKASTVTSQRPLDLEAEMERLTRKARADAAALLPQIEAQVAKEAARLHAEAVREADAGSFDSLEPEVEEDDLDASAQPKVRRSDYVPSEQEAKYLTRDEDGLPTLRLVHAGGRLVVWSPLHGGALLNPKGPGLRHFGLIGSGARGSAYHAVAYRAADLRPGRRVELHREPHNEHDKNAVALYVPGARAPFGYVQRGRAPALARRMDAGEEMAAVCLHGPGPRQEDGSAFVLIGSSADIAAMFD